MKKYIIPQLQIVTMTSPAVMLVVSTGGDSSTDFSVSAVGDGPASEAN